MGMPKSPRRISKSPNDAELISRRKLLQTGTGLFALSCFPSEILANDTSPSLKLITRKSRALGSSISAKVLHSDVHQAKLALDTAFKNLHRIESVLSIYQPNSQVSQLNKVKRLDNPDPQFTDILNRSIQWSRRSKGAFDITVQPLWDLYQTSKKNKSLPNPQEIAKARSNVDWRRIQVAQDSIELQGTETAITLNGIAQGYASDCFRQCLESFGIEHALIDCGEIATMGTNPKGNSWSVGIQHPRRFDSFSAITKMDGRCLATSGDYATSFSDDHRFNHLFDPSTGHSPDQLSSVSILAPNGTDADALSTAAFILGPEKGINLVQECPSTDAYMTLKDGTNIMTKGFPCNA